MLKDRQTEKETHTFTHVYTNTHTNKHTHVRTNTHTHYDENITPLMTFSGKSNGVKINMKMKIK